VRLPEFSPESRQTGIPGLGFFHKEAAKGWSGRPVSSEYLINLFSLYSPSGREQIKFLLGHASIQTTERYLGSEQEIAVAVNDNLGL
jgi:hypothetical protein